LLLSLLAFGVYVVTVADGFVDVDCVGAVVVGRGVYGVIGCGVFRLFGVIISYTAVPVGTVCYCDVVVDVYCVADVAGGYAVVAVIIHAVVNVYIVVCVDAVAIVLVDALVDVALLVVVGFTVYGVGICGDAVGVVGVWLCWYAQLC